MREIVKANMLKGQKFGAFYPSGKLLVFVTYVLYLMTGNTLTIQQTVKVIGLLEIARIPLMFYIPSSLQFPSEMQSSLTRIQVC